MNAAREKLRKEYEEKLAKLEREEAARAQLLPILEGLPEPSIFFQSSGELWLRWKQPVISTDPAIDPATIAQALADRVTLTPMAWIRSTFVTIAPEYSEARTNTDAHAFRARYGNDRGDTPAGRFKIEMGQHSRPELIMYAESSGLALRFTIELEGPVRGAIVGDPVLFRGVLVRYTNKRVIGVPQSCNCQRTGGGGDTDLGWLTVFPRNPDMSLPEFLQAVSYQTEKA
jgi:hypothetical protein